MEAQTWISVASTVIAFSALVVTVFRERYQQRREDAIRSEQQCREDAVRSEQRDLEAEVRRQQHEREDRLRTALQKRQDQLAELYREAVPHIEFDLMCSFYGPEEDYYLAEFLLTAHNKGRVKHDFNSILLKVLGVGRNEELREWPGNEPRLHFPHKVVDDEEVIPKDVKVPSGSRGYSSLFVEPGVKQVITYITRIPSSIKYIRARGKFSYSSNKVHSIERVFEVAQR